MATMKLLKGSARRYKVGKGKSISRRAHDDIRAKEYGFKSRYFVEKYRKGDTAYLERKDMYNTIFGKGKGPVYIRSPLSEFDLFLRGQELEGNPSRVVMEFFDTFGDHRGNKKWETQWHTLQVVLGYRRAGEWEFTSE